MRTHRRVGVTIVLSVLCAATVVVMSQTRSADSSAPALESKEFSTPGTAGLRAYLDPETGDLTVGTQPLGAIALDPDTQNALRHDDQGLTLTQHANGAVSMNLEGRYQSVSVVRIDENGKVVVCTDNVDGVERTLSEPVSHPATLEVK
jgi:hypothetical protein